MRSPPAALLVLVVGACSVPDKRPESSDGGIDAAVDPDGTPETTITSAPADFSNAGTATFEFTSNLPDARFTCSLDGEAGAPCTSPYVRSLADGTHSFSVRAINASGDGDDSPAEHLWSIDTVAPITTLTETPPAADNSTMVRFSFIANEMFITFECSLDGAAFTPCRSGDSFGPVGDGAHSFAVRAKDRAGNIDASPAVHAWQVDTSTPDTTLVSGPDGAVATATATFTFLSPDAGPSATFECSLDGSPFASCTSPVSYEGLAMGVHTFAVRVRDANGNDDPTPATRTWTIDATPPETSILDAPSGTVAMASAIISFTSNEPSVTYACSLDGAQYVGCTSPFNANNLAQGGHTFAVIATDAAGNADASPATAGWSVDTVAPDLDLAGVDDGQISGPRISFVWTVTEGVVDCRLDGGAWIPCASPFAYNHPAGASGFEVRATDAAGNQTIVTRSWTVECQPPDEVGAIGVLHMGDLAQVLINTTGGPAATLGPTDQAEATDPTFGPARFGDGLVFAAADGDLVAWPLAAGSVGTLSFELWSRPQALSGTREVIASGDGRIAVRVTADSATTVRYSATVTDTSGVLHTVTSGPYSADGWHHVVVSVSDPSLQLWADADLTALSDARGVSIALDTLRIGGTYGGDIDEAWISLAGLTNDGVLPRYCPVSAVRITSP